MSYNIEDGLAEVTKCKEEFLENPCNETAIKMLSAEIVLLGMVNAGLNDRITALEKRTQRLERM